MLLTCAAIVGGECALAQAPVAPPPGYTIEFSTHDATTTVTNTPVGLPEAWADVKTTGGLVPGSGWTFSVGTIELSTTNVQLDNPTFSDVVVDPPDSPAVEFQIQSTSTFAVKQVVVLQARGPDPMGPVALDPDQDIRWQRLLYGFSDLLGPTGQGPIGRTATNARAVSVWPVWDPVSGTLDQEETRVAICGETYDCRLPNNQGNGAVGWEKFLGAAQFASNYPRGLPSGYIAVYRGDGEFLWSRQFFFEDAGIVPGQPEGACAITDVSIRVEEIDGQVRDVVTYCGISSFGLRTSETTSLTPYRSFPAPSPTVVGYSPASGWADNSNNGLALDQWDGIVGRISNVHSQNPVLGSMTTKEFHAVVGGVEQDGLWGIAEMQEDRFAVVGGTANTSFATSTSPMFPFTNTVTNWNNETDYCVGTLLVFDASQTRNTTVPWDLILETSVSIGNVGASVATHASDVAVHFDAFLRASGEMLDRIAVVGTTTDSQLFASFTSGGVAPTIPYGGGTDGFLATAIDRFFYPFPPADVMFLGGSFQGRVGDGRWCGVSSWNEYLDHVVVAGRAAGSTQDLHVASFFADTAATAGPRENLIALRDETLPTTSNEEPAVMGAVRVTASLSGSQAGLDYNDFGLGSRAGGGVAVDDRARVNVVGVSDAVGFPVVGGPLARGHLSAQDALRTVVTMMPERVGRTDGTGQQVHNMQTIPAAPAGMTGATTPTCALLPFGTQIAGMPAPSLRRMMIDWEGPAPSATPNPSNLPSPPPVHFLLIDRPPVDTSFVMSVIQFGVPTPPSSLVLGIENWVSSGVTHSFAASNGPFSFRIPLVLPPATGATFSVQVATYLLNPLACTGQGVASTPAIVFSY